MKKLLYFFSIFFALPVCLIGQVSIPLFQSGTFEVTESCTGGAPETFISNGILATGTSSNNVVEVLDKCRRTYRAKDMIHLRPGFHAGQLNNVGYFKTEFFNPDVKLVTPDASCIVNGVVNVPKWEKLEIAFRLPSQYEDAVASFFAHYYDAITPGNQVDPLTDLNPYASDSLEVRVHLTSPSGRGLIKNGFFMREANWGPIPTGSNGPVPGAADLEVDLNHPLHNYNWRVRFAPDEVDLTVPWNMKIEVRVSYNLLFPQSYDMGNFVFLCVDPLPDNHGYLHVNANNNRYLRFDDGTDYLGLGINLAEGRKWSSEEALLRENWFKMQKLDFDYINSNIAELSQNGGNEVRISMTRGSFAFEWENLGVYDAYSTDQLCVPVTGVQDPYGLTGPYPNEGNRQYHAWALDKLLENCRDNNVYVQLNLFLAVNYHAYQTFLWGDNAYYNTFVVGNPAPSGLDGWDTKKFFISQSNFNPSNGVSGVINVGSIYYWKRHLKYLMARWGYSTNIAWFETFNEIDCILRFRHEDLSGEDHMCFENRIVFPQENSTREYIKIWHQYLINYVKNDLDNTEYNVVSPNHLWSVSYASSDQTLFFNDPTYFQLYDLPEIDIVDLHSYDWEEATQSQQQINKDRFEIINGNDQGAIGFYTRFSKPCCFGEGSTYGKKVYSQNFNGTFKDDERLTRIFQNYRMTFHNMIWSSALSGTCSVVKTWQWENVCWLQEGMQRPIRELGVNNFSTNILGGINNIQPVGSISSIVPLPNIKLLDQFVPLRSFMTDFNPTSSSALKYYYNTANQQEGVIHTNGNGVGGWLHHAAKYLDNSYYYTSSTITLNPPNGSPIIIDPDEHFTDCQGSFPFNNTLTLDPINTNGIIDQVGISYPTFIGQQNLPDITITTNNQSKELILSNHLLTCTYENESVAFKAFTSANRIKKPEETSTENPCFEELKLNIIQMKDAFQIKRSESSQLNLSPEKKLTIYVTDVLGRLVIPLVQLIDQVTINTSPLTAGMYSLTLISGSCKTSRKFVKL